MRLSYSKLSTFRQCPLRYKLAYLARLPDRPRGNARFSKLLHKALADYHFYARRDGRVHIEEALARYDALWQRPEDRLTREYQDGRAILARYAIDNRNRRDVPALLEYTLTAPLGPHTITARIDRADHVEGGGYRLVDYKLHREPVSQDEADSDLQLSFYQMAFEQAEGAPVREMTLYYLRSGERLTTRRSRAEVAETARLTIETAEQIQTLREFSPCPGDVCKTCGYKAYCPAWSERPQEAPPVWVQNDLELAAAPAPSAPAAPQLSLFG